MTHQEALESRLASSRGMSSEEIEAQFQQNRLARLSVETPPHEEPSLTASWKANKQET